MKYYFHGSYDKLPIGTVMTGRGEDYKKDWQTLGEPYLLLEKRRPSHMIAHHEGVFMCSVNDQNDNDYGLSDIDCCGGATDYILRVLPIGPVQKHDLHWMTQATILIDDWNGAPGHDKQHLMNKINKCLDGYWNGIPSDEPMWEYIARKVEVLESHEYEDYEFTPLDVNILSKQQMIDYLEVDNLKNENNNLRLKYIYPDMNQNEHYLCLFNNCKLPVCSNYHQYDDVPNFNKMIGVLIMEKDANGNNVLLGVSVDEDYKQQGNAKKLLDAYFQYSAERSMPVAISSYSDDGEKYIKRYIDQKLEIYPALYMASRTKKQIENHLFF